MEDRGGLRWSSFGLVGEFFRRDERSGRGDEEDDVGTSEGREGRI